LKEREKEIQRKDGRRGETENAAYIHISYKKGTSNDVTTVANLVTLRKSAGTEKAIKRHTTRTTTIIKETNKEVPKLRRLKTLARRNPQVML